MTFGHSWSFVDVDSSSSLACNDDPLVWPDPAEVDDVDAAAADDGKLSGLSLVTSVNEWRPPDIQNPLSIDPLP